MRRFIGVAAVASLSVSPLMVSPLARRRYLRRTGKERCTACLNPIGPQTGGLKNIYAAAAAGHFNPAVSGRCLSVTDQHAG
jgi:hypothetical protein